MRCPTLLSQFCCFVSDTCGYFTTKRAVKKGEAVSIDWLDCPALTQGKEAMAENCISCGGPCRKTAKNEEGPIDWAPHRQNFSAEQVSLFFFGKADCMIFEIGQIKQIDSATHMLTLSPFWLSTIFIREICEARGIPCPEKWRVTLVKKVHIFQTN